MENLKSAINTIEERLLAMAHIQELPHAIFRDEYYESIAGTQKAIKVLPDLIKPYGSFYAAYNDAVVINENSDKNVLAFNYQYIQSCIEDTEIKISKAQSAYQLAEKDLQQSEDAHQQILTQHSISLLSGQDFEHDTIQLAELNKTAAQQRMKNAYNAETLLTLKRKMLKKILSHIVTHAGILYYQAIFDDFQTKLIECIAEYAKFKAAVSFEDVSYKYGKESDKDKNKIYREIARAFIDKDYESDSVHRQALREAIENSLVGDGEGVDLFELISQQYKTNLASPVLAPLPAPVQSAA